MNIYEEAISDTKLGFSHAQIKFLGKCFLEQNDLKTVLTEVSEDQHQEIWNNLSTASELSPVILNLSQGSCSLDKIPIYPCRIYDLSNQDLPLSLELRAWKVKKLMNSSFPSLLHLNNESNIVSEHFKPLQQVFYLNILATKNIIKKNDKISKLTEGNANDAVLSTIRGQKTIVSPPDSPTFAYNEDQVQLKKGFLIEIRWNKERIYQLQGLVHAKQVLLYVPYGYHIHQCKLQIIFWVRGKHIGEIVLQDESILEFLSTCATSSDMDGEDEEDTGTWFDIKSNEMISKGSDKFLSGRGMISLRGRVSKRRYKPITASSESISIEQEQGMEQTRLSSYLAMTRINSPFSSRMSAGDKNRQHIDKGHRRRNQRSNLVKIQSSLDHTSMGWRHFYPLDKSLDTAHDSNQPVKDQDNQPIPFHKAVPIKASQTDLRSVDDTSKSDSMTSFVEYPFFERGIEVNQDENRVCWRGRVKPKNFFNNSGSIDNKSVFLSRSKKLIHVQSIQTIQIASTMTYFQDSNDAVNDHIIDDKLSITIREIVSNGPGLIRRHYRIHISSNTGATIGSVDLFDTYEDLRDILGKSKLYLLDGPKEQWNMKEIFEYIVQERCLIELNPDIEEIDRETSPRGPRDDLDDSVSVYSKYSSKSRKQYSQTNKFLVKLIRESELKGILINHSRKNHHNRSANMNPLSPTSLQQRSILSPLSKLSSLNNPDIFYPDAILSPTSEKSLNNYYISLSNKLTSKNRGLRSIPTSPNRNIESSISQYPVPHLSRLFTIHNQKISWIRVCSKIWNMAGNKYHVVVLFASPNLLLTKNPDEYFRQYETGHEGLKYTDIIFRCRDSKSNQVWELKLSGSKVSKVIDRRYPLNLETKYRREKFGYFLVTYLLLEYRSDNTCEVMMNLDGLKKGVKYVIKMKQENMLMVDNSNTKTRIVKDSNEMNQDVAIDGNRENDPTFDEDEDDINNDDEDVINPQMDISKQSHEKTKHEEDTKTNDKDLSHEEARSRYGSRPIRSIITSFEEDKAKY